MACSNCFNGCVDIISDQCVRYTGLDVPALGILTGDPLSRVEESLTTFLVSALDGTGIKPYVNPEIICALVEANLPACGELTIVDLITGLIKSVCDLQAQINIIIVDVAAINTTLATLNSTYTTSCLTGTIDAESTHSVLQALITNFCALVASLPNTYVALNQIDQIIANWIAAHTSSTLISSKMVPYVAVPYFGPTSYFNGDGAGTGDWINIYLCNGLNGAPDLRGRTVVGCTAMLGTKPLDPEVASPVYTLRSTTGVNNYTLISTEMPSHTHAALTTATNAPHFHYEFNADASGEHDSTVLSTTYPTVIHNVEAGYSYRITGSTTSPTLGRTSTSTPAITADTVNAATGGNQPHFNIQPSMGAYYIIYIP